MARRHSQDFALPLGHAAQNQAMGSRVDHAAMAHTKRVGVNDPAGGPEPDGEPQLLRRNSNDVHK